MNNLNRYLKIWFIFFRTSLARDLSFRLSFFTGIIGSFCFVALSYFLIFFITSKANFGNFSQAEMWVLLGNFYILQYLVFFFFYRSAIRLIRNIRSGAFDFYLLKPMDSQFMVSVLSGGVHNLLAILFGVAVLVWSLINLGNPVNIYQIVFAIITIILGSVAFYSLVLLLICLNFRYGYLEDVLGFLISFQELARYPIDAFLRLPLLVLIFVIPFSALTTVPTVILIAGEFPVTMVSLFLFFSAVFILLVRKLWFKTIRQYTSGN
jgi:ABC-2 type transport system permease protein